MKHARALVLTALATSSAIAVACVLADPPPFQNQPPLSRPSILRLSVSPPPDQLILAPPTSTPLTFSVPVSLDPNQPFSFRVFVDLDSTSTQTPTKLIAVNEDGGAVGEAPDAAGSSIVVLGFEFPASTPIDFTTCHTFTFVVAYAFTDNSSAKPVDPPGGDSVTWFYQPIADCTYYDAAPPTYDAGDDGPDE